MSKNKEWEIKIRGGGQIADTGDYDDPIYVLTNGKIELYTKDELELEPDELGMNSMANIIVSTLNTLDAKWEQDDSHLHVISYLETWKNELYEYLEQKGLVEEYQQWSMNKAQGYDTRTNNQSS